MGDFNINILNCDSDKDTTDFIDTMYASSLYPTINTPTRITATSKTLIGNIFCNDFTKKISAGNILTSISDHLTQYLLISNQTEVSLNNSKKETPKIRKFNKKCFLEEFRNTDWDHYLRIYKKDTDLSFELFLRKIKFLYNKNSPFSTPKRKIKRDTSKPWMTSGILKSINVKNKLYKEFCQATNSTRRDILHQKFKNYRNQIVTLNRLCKENYFKTYFETNKKDSKRIWYGVKNLINTKISKTGSHHITLNIDNKTTSDDFIIANHFNSFFTSKLENCLKKFLRLRRPSVLS